MEFEDFEEAVHSFSMIDGINFKELKISAQFDRSSICTSEAFYRNQSGRQNGSEPRRFEGDNNSKDNNNRNNNNSYNNNNYNNNYNNNNLNKRAGRPIFTKNSRGNEFKHPTTSFRYGEPEEGPTCSEMKHQSPSDSNNLEEACSSGCKYTFCGRNHRNSVHQQAESSQNALEKGASSNDDITEEDKVNYLQQVEEKFVVKSNSSHGGHKFDDSMSVADPTNFGDRLCSKSSDPNEDNGQQMFEKTEVLDETKILEMKHTAVEGTDNSQHQLNIDQSSMNMKITNPGCGPNSSCQKCGIYHGPHCPARGKTCDSCGKLNHFARMCFSKIRHHSTSNSPNLQEAWKSECGSSYYGKSHHCDNKQAESFPSALEEESSSKDDIVARSSKVDVSNFHQEFEEKSFAKDYLLKGGDKFDEFTLSGGNQTNIERQVCDKSLYPYKDVERRTFEETEVLDETRTLEVKHATVEEKGNSLQQPKVDQSSWKTNHRFGSISSRPCHKCGDHHGPRCCPAWGKTCENCGGPGHFAKMCNPHHPSKSTKTFSHNRGRNNRNYNGRYSRPRITTLQTIN